MQYYILVNNEQRGPYSLEELRMRHITADTPTRNETMEQWAPARTVQGLEVLFLDTQTAAESHVDRTTNTSRSAAQTPPQSSGLGKTLLMVIIVLLLIIIALASTCPSKQEHQEAVMTEVNNFIDGEAMDIDDNIMAAFGRMLASSVIGVAMDNMLQVHNYGLWSVGEVRYAGESKTVSIGIFNHVFTTFDEDDLKDISKGEGSDGE